MADETTLIQPAAAPAKKKKDEVTTEIGKDEVTTATEVVAVAPKRYAVKVGKESPVRSVRSASIIFTDAEQVFGEDDARLVELQRNPWLEVREVTE